MYHTICLFVSFIIGVLAMPTTSHAQINFRHVLADSACYEEGYSLVAIDTGYLVSGAYNCSGSWRGELIKLNSHGDTVWIKKDRDINGYIRKAADGNLLFIGGNHAGLSYDTVVVFKTNLQGDTIWTYHQFIPQCNNQVYDLINTRDGGYAMCGIYAINCTTGIISDNAFVTKLTADGKLEWTKYLTGIGNQELFVIRQLHNGRYALFGWTDSKGAGLADNYWVLLNEQGDSITATTNGDSTNNYGYGMDVLPDGGYITAGYSDSIYAMRLDSNGNLLWRKSLGTPSGSAYFKAAYTLDKHFVFIGCQSDTAHGGICTATLFKTDTLGNLIWKKNFGGLFREFNTDGPGAFLMAGYYGLFPTLPGIYYIRFDTTYNPLDTLHVGIEPLATPSDFVRCLNNYVTSGMPIQFAANNNETVSLELFNLLGESIVSVTLNTSMLVPTNNLVAGMYIWRSYQHNQTQTGKVIIQ